MEFGKHAAALEAQGHAIIKLSMGEPDFGPPPAVVRAARKVLEENSLAYTSALGITPLREAIAGFYRAMHGVEVDPSRIVVTAGASATFC